MTAVEHELQRTVQITRETQITNAARPAEGIATAATCLVPCQWLHGTEGSLLF